MKLKTLLSESELSRLDQDPELDINTDNDIDNVTLLELKGIAKIMNIKPYECVLILNARGATL